MKNSTLFLVGLICYLSLVLGGMGKGKHYEIDFSPTSCSVPASVKANIQSHDEAVQEIVSQITHKLYKGMAFQELAKYVDRFGSRMTGSEALEASIDYLRDEMQKIPVFRNVHTENVTVPKWLR
jgi:carboxypeptidase Q